VNLKSCHINEIVRWEINKGYKELMKIEEEDELKGTTSQWMREEREKGEKNWKENEKIDKKRTGELKERTKEEKEREMSYREEGE
jgi:hypothetical protein